MCGPTSLDYDMAPVDYPHFSIRPGCGCERCEKWRKWCAVQQKKKDNKKAREKHLKDIAILNQNRREK